MSDHVRFHALPETMQPSVLELNCNKLKQIIDALPKYGMIKYDAATRYWYIELPAEWGEAQDNIVSVTKETFSDSPWYMESEQLCMCWDHMVNAVHPRNTAPAVIDCVSPPSVVGPHVSLATKDISDPDLPECFEIGHRVDFEFHGITSLRTQRPMPQNIPGQCTDTDGMRYYPMRWIFANIDFIGFEYIPRYPAHVSICCVAVQLNVEEVDEFAKYWKSSIAIPNADSLQKPINDKTNDIEFEENQHTQHLAMSLKRAKPATNGFECAVFGYVRDLEKKEGMSAPALIKYLIMNFYVLEKGFEEHSESNEMDPNPCAILARA